MTTEDTPKAPVEIPGVAGSPLDIAGATVAHAMTLAAATFEESQTIPKPETFDDFLAVVTLILDQCSEIQDGLADLAEKVQGGGAEKWLNHAPH
jgi:hypothetical protein